MNQQEWLQQEAKLDHWARHLVLLNAFIVFGAIYVMVNGVAERGTLAATSLILAGSLLWPLSGAAAILILQRKGFKEKRPGSSALVVIMAGPASLASALRLPAAGQSRFVVCDNTVCHDYGRRVQSLQGDICDACGLPPIKVGGYGQG